MGLPEAETVKVAGVFVSTLWLEGWLLSATGARSMLALTICKPLTPTPSLPEFVFQATEMVMAPAVGPSYKLFALFLNQSRPIGFGLCDVAFGVLVKVIPHAFAVLK